MSYKAHLKAHSQAFFFNILQNAGTKTFQWTSYFCNNEEMKEYEKA